jgi:putative ABC transport system permease protein
LNGIYLTPEIAERVFGDEDPLGKPINFLEIENAYVAGLIEPPPTNSSIRFDCIAPLRIEWSPVWWDSWTNVALTGYIRTTETALMNDVEKKVVDFAAENGFASIWSPKLQPLKDIHLGSNHLRFDVMNFGKNDKTKVYSLGFIAILVLFIASINFINLSSARATKRAKEVTLRKVVGGKRKQIFAQFMSESLIITFIAFFIALALFEISIPYLNDFLHNNSDFNFFENPIFIISLFIAVGFIGFLAGIYPAMIISGFKITGVLKGNFNTSKSGTIIRRILVVSQFAVSISLIASVLIVKSQIDFLNEVDLGYNRENVLSIRNQNDETFRLEMDNIQKLPSVVSMGSTNSHTGGTLQKYQVAPEGMEEDKGGMFDRLVIDDRFIPTLKISLIKGRNFNSELASDENETIILNESAIEFANWDEDPIGKTVTVHKEDGTTEQRTVIGVVKDFNFTTARRTINPMFLLFSPDTFPRLFVKTDGINNEQVIDEIEKIHNELNPDIPFRFRYFDEEFNFQFADERNFADNMGVFSILAIIVSCLGLLGLSAFTTEQRTKEIGIRKVLGSSVSQIVKLLSFDFTKWVLLANLIAWPVTWFAMNKWLESFIYRMNINIGIFVLSGLIVIIIALITISFQTIKAANSNPVEALKYE